MGRDWSLSTHDLIGALEKDHQGWECLQQRAKLAAENSNPSRLVGVFERSFGQAGALRRRLWRNTVRKLEAVSLEEHPEENDVETEVKHSEETEMVCPALDITHGKRREGKHHAASESAMRGTTVADLPRSKALELSSTAREAGWRFLRTYLAMKGFMDSRPQGPLPQNRVVEVRTSDSSR